MPQPLPQPLRHSLTSTASGLLATQSAQSDGVSATQSSPAQRRKSSSAWRQAWSARHSSTLQDPVHASPQLGQSTVGSAGGQRQASSAPACSSSAGSMPSTALHPNAASSKRHSTTPRGMKRRRSGTMSGGEFSRPWAWRKEPKKLAVPSPSAVFGGASNLCPAFRTLSELPNAGGPRSFWRPNDDTSFAPHFPANERIGSVGTPGA